MEGLVIDGARRPHGTQMALATPSSAVYTYGNKLDTHAARAPGHIYAAGALPQADYDTGI
eukprot:CAMPEP_0170182796 /NCGR_PEP_ID=MMETSP0040_2-20121228/28852_1 /TAXON_ID=641309 /ORGANISM="Lotharella oceanica, Strain CCMP622" /LENGTH=59 /DNA_ID=CAMNT_0010428343 /DNA_START=301 /DNA_END=480 /DNA_ORIENTATION=+